MPDSHPSLSVRLSAVALLIALLAAGCSDAAKQAADSSKSGLVEPAITTDVPVSVLAEVVERAHLAVLVPNFENLKSTGLVPTLSVAQYGDFWRAEVGAYNAARPENRPLDLTVVSWDPLTPESTQGACREVLDSGATVVATSANFPESGYRCFSDAGVVVITVGPVTRLRLTRFGGLIFSVLPPRETLATQTVNELHQTNLLPSSVALIGNTQEGDRQGADAAVGSLESLGYAVHQERVDTAEGVVEVRSQANDVAQRIREAGSEAIVFASNATVANELALHMRQLAIPVFFIDIDGIASLDAAQRLGPLWVNTIAATALRPTSATPSTFEAECQGRFRQFIRGEAATQPSGDWAQRSGQRPATNRGAPVDLIEPSGDVGYHECTIVGVLGFALDTIDGAGDSAAIADALRSVPDLPVALADTGGFSRSQHWLTTDVRLVQLSGGDQCTFTETCWLDLG